MFKTASWCGVLLSLSACDPQRCTPVGPGVVFCHEGRLQTAAYLPLGGHPSVPGFACEVTLDGGDAVLSMKGELCSDIDSDPNDRPARFVAYCDLPDGDWRVIEPDGTTRQVQIVDGGMECER